MFELGCRCVTFVFGWLRHLHFLKPFTVLQDLLMVMVPWQIQIVAVVAHINRHKATWSQIKCSN